MNSYFKTSPEIAGLFQQAIDRLHQQKGEAAIKLFDEAFRHHPYHLQAHYELSIYYASIKDAEHFREHFFICCNLDASVKENILTNEVVLNAFSGEELARFVALKKEETHPLRSFASIDPDPSYGDVYLLFKPGYKREIETIYQMVKPWDDNCFLTDEPAPESPWDLYNDADFTKIDHFRLYYVNDRGSLDQPPEIALAAIQQLSPYVEDVRFLTWCECDDHFDEIIIQNGLFHIYRHHINNDTSHERMAYYDKLAYVDSVVRSHPDDTALKVWLYDSYIRDVLHFIDYGDELVPPNLSKVIALSDGTDHWIDYIKAKLHLKKEDTNGALEYFRKAAARNPPHFEVYYELGKLQALHSTQYQECIGNLSRALETKTYTDIYIHRAIAYLKLGQVSAGEADIAAFINPIETYNNGLLVRGGQLLQEAGFPVQARMLFEAALEKNGVYENSLIEKRGSAKDSFYDSDLLENAGRRSRIYTGLSNLAETPKEKLHYALLALTEKTDVTTLYNVGVAMQQAGRAAEAETYYDKTLELDNNYLKALLNKCIIRFYQKDYDIANELADKMLSLNSSYAEPLIIKAGICFDWGDLATALECYNAYVVLKPDGAAGHYGVGFILLHQRQDAKAIPSLEKAIDLAPQSTQVNEIWSNLACCYNNMGALEQAIQAAQRSIAINANYYHPYYMLACVYEKQGRREEAVEMAQKVLLYDPLQRTTLLNEPELEGIRNRI